MTIQKLVSILQGFNVPDLEIQVLNSYEIPVPLTEIDVTLGEDGGAQSVVLR